MRWSWLAAAAIATAGATACLPTPPRNCGEHSTPPPQFALVAQAGVDPCDPPPPCIGCGEGRGDPHIVTFDGRNYGFHTAAEVVATRAPDGTFEVQWRQEPLGGTNTAGISAVAMLINGSRVSVVGTTAIRVDGALITLDEGQVMLLPTGVTIHNTGASIVVVSPRRDAAVHLVRHPTSMGVLVDPPDDHRGAMEGLLGDADGDPTNDVVFADGTVSDTSWNDVHPRLAETWRVTGANTLFDYDRGKGPDTYWDPTFPERQPRLEDFTQAERDAAEALCRAAGITDQFLIENCTFDVLVTGDASFAELAARQQQAREPSGQPAEGGDRPRTGNDWAPHWFDETDGEFTGIWDTSRGILILVRGPEGLVAIYGGEDGDGTIRGQLNGQKYSGIWGGSGSDVECDTEWLGTRWWGQVEITFADDDNSFEGVWGFCTGDLDHRWSGTRIDEATSPR